MATEEISVDGKNYDYDSLSDSAKAAIASIQFCDERIQQLSSEWAVADTARMAYAAALSREVKSS